MPTQAEFDAFEEYYAEAKQRIDDRLDEIIETEEGFAGKRRILSHAAQGGKRVRPVLTMLVADVYGVPYDKALDHAAIVELIHLASLVADDRYDGDATRRGAPALWKILEKLPFGRKGHKVTTGLTVMAENGLMALALELADDPDVVQAMGHGTRHLVDGFFAEGQNFTWGLLGGGYDKYVEINRMKTGGLFGMAAWMPATYVSVPAEQEDAARKYGEETGILYQVTDDIADGDIPSFIKDDNAELEKWYGNATAWVQNMPDHEKTSMMETAPAWMVYKMASNGSILDEVDVSFIPAETTG
jgi:geranylgeranyl pyrophosphate synthase